MKQKYTLTEAQLRQIIYETIETSLNEGKFGRALGTAALGAAMALGGNSAMAQDATSPQIEQPSSINTYNPPQTPSNEELAKRKAERGFLDDIKVQEKEYGRMVVYDMELIVEADTTAAEMYKRIMSVLYNENGVTTNEIDGNYQITKKTESNDDSMQFFILIKDNKFKITARIISESDYSHRHSSFKVSGNDILENWYKERGKGYINYYAKTLLSNPKSNFDF